MNLLLALRSSIIPFETDNAVPTPDREKPPTLGGARFVSCFVSVCVTLVTLLYER